MTSLSLNHTKLGDHLGKAFQLSYLGHTLVQTKPESPLKVDTSSVPM
jgi:hypothetical protein